MYIFLHYIAFQLLLTSTVRIERACELGARACHSLYCKDPMVDNSGHSIPDIDTETETSTRLQESEYSLDLPERDSSTVPRGTECSTLSYLQQMVIYRRIKH